MNPSLSPSPSSQFCQSIEGLNCSNGIYIATPLIPVILQNGSLVGTVQVGNGSQLVIIGSLTVIGDLTVSDGGVLELNSSTTPLINGSIQLGENSTVIFEGSSRPISVLGCANLSGVLNVYVNSTHHQNIEVIRSGCINGAFSSIKGTSTNPCYEVTGHSLVASSSSLILSFEWTQKKECEIEEQALIPGLSVPVSLAVIIVAILVAVIVIVIVLIAIPYTRRKVFPFATRERFKQKETNT
jgi:hypothetical protein